MTPEAQQIAIAEECGIEFEQRGIVRLWRPTGTKLWKRPARLPDYLNDLNAIAAARKTLKGAAISEFIDCLCVVVHGVHCDLIHTDSEFFEILDAPADKQAEAFLRTLGKWDSENAKLTHGGNNEKDSR